MTKCGTCNTKPSEKDEKLMDDFIRSHNNPDKKLIHELQEALIWCSGSDDFQEGGKARVGWLKIRHLIND